uniref:UBC core domain-containing protein n=1 Tax=Norrisiella sphaerica TaxID=552664 RepID=A0A7S2QST3_9EUKA|mmetsp:Transcript_2318/g.3320  ORF Transcript_2318/g.3320 Transcript_2318/m.3320 type:complete len:305 (+) Transcript_2318:83-997(+)|eukprot:CAMPEP_0184479876 /NCGR_PEP_ID=MMETSP0113_2-20130426/1423_1 /TAXON_ID=91329 /ORGANISM="Norrisiella sphaerica, Strain BC52" /LENGTH=304 /DNA_ID=CAMNT_0026858039 /DNA_START=63 /DNA_END=977 /DNA_ORIENTATION=+
MALFRRLRQVQHEKKADRRLSRAELRLEKDVEELTFNRAKVDGLSCSIEFRSTSNLKFSCIIKPTSGPYGGGEFVFAIIIPEEYPFWPPEVNCETRIFHPNMCLRTGKVGLPILNNLWKPVYTVNKVILEIQKLFLQPNLESAMNLECARLVRTDIRTFRETVQRTMKGGYYFGEKWECIVAGDGTPIAGRKKKRSREVSVHKNDKRSKREKFSLDTTMKASFEDSKCANFRSKNKTIQGKKRSKQYSFEEKLISELEEKLQPSKRRACVSIDTDYYDAKTPRCTMDLPPSKMDCLVFPEEELK